MNKFENLKLFTNRKKRRIIKTVLIISFGLFLIYKINSYQDEFLLDRTKNIINKTFQISNKYFEIEQVKM